MVEVEREPGQVDNVNSGAYGLGMPTPISPAVAFAATHQPRFETRVEEILEYVNQCIVDAMERRDDGPIQVPTTRSGWSVQDLETAADHFRAVGWRVTSGVGGVTFTLDYPPQLAADAARAEQAAIYAPRPGEPTMLEYERMAQDDRILDRSRRR